MPHIVKSTILDAPTGAVWNVLRDFNGHDRWHPAVATSTIERAQASDKIGCIRRFKLKDGSELREQLLALSDLEQSFSYCLLDPRGAAHLLRDRAAGQLAGHLTALASECP